METAPHINFWCCSDVLLRSRPDSPMPLETYATDEGTFFSNTTHHLGKKGGEMFFSGSFRAELLVATLRQSRKEMSVDEKVEIVLDSSALNFILHDSSV